MVARVVRVHGEPQHLRVTEPSTGRQRDSSARQKLLPVLRLSEKRSVVIGSFRALPPL